MYEKVSKRISSFDSFIFGNLPQVKLFPKFLSEMPTQTQTDFPSKKKKKERKRNFLNNSRENNRFRCYPYILLDWPF